METLIASSGRTIAYERRGDGPPLVLVHGGFVDRSAWTLVVPLLAAHFTVYTPDRLGHGDSDPYPLGATMRDEAQAIADLVHAIGRPVYLAGHSSGARVALHATQHTDLVRKLALYEPPGLGLPLTAATQRQIDEAAATGDRERLAWLGIAGVVGDATGQRPPIESLKRSPIWPLLYRNALSVPAEAQLYAAYRFDPAAFSSFTIPTVLFLGTESLGGYTQQSLEALHRALPGSTVIYLEGQGHGAMFAAPELLAARLAEFWTR